MTERAERPWGGWTVLHEGAGYKVKQITVEPGGRLSLQRHQQRTEHWFVVQGVIEATVGSVVKTLTTGESADVPIGELHRIANPGPGVALVIEVQQGPVCEESDIERLQDDYGR